MGISDEELLRKVALLPDSLSDRLSPKQADRFVDLLVGSFGDGLDDLIAETEYRVDHWAERIMVMILFHVRRTGREPNTVWLPRRFARSVTLGPGTISEWRLPPVDYPITVLSIETLESVWRVTPEDLAVGRITNRKSHAVVGVQDPWIESFFVERHVGYQVV